MVTAKYEHRDLLGATASGTLHLEIIPTRGLDYVVDLPNTSAGNDVLELTTRHDLQNSSFSFQVYDQDFTRDGDSGVPVRHLISVRLIDVSPVATPAYPDATVGLRSPAIQFDADPSDVFDMARENQLGKLFCRTDNRGPQRKGAQILKELMSVTADERRRRSWHEAQVELMSMVEPGDKPLTPQQEQVEALRLKSGRQALTETMST
jgi:HK97 family phage prohead protease